jgi:hypothetical protein
MGRFLIIPDIHQNLIFLSSILEAEDLSSYDQIVCLGDYFDARHPLFDNEKALKLTAEMILQLHRAYPGKLCLLWGNHDIIYCRFREFVLRVGEERVREAAASMDLGDHLIHASIVNNIWPGDLWFRLRMAVVCDGWLLSHAGIHQHFWPQADTPAAALAQLCSHFDAIIDNLFDNEDHPLLEAGPPRGGQAEVGGPLWQDWEEEFADSLPFAQIVGHSAASEPRQIGRSWCIDAAGTAYATLTAGELAIKTVNMR